MMIDFHFIRPWWFLAFLPLVWVLFRFYKNTQKESQWREEVDPALLPHLLDGEASSLTVGLFVAIGLLWLLAVIALAGPSWERLLTPVYKGLQERVLVVDLSRSMNATDVKPSRLDRVRQKLNDVLDLSEDTQTALIVYSAVPYVVSPLTDDVQTIRSMLPSINTEIVPAQGSRTALALIKATELLQGSGSKGGSIWLFTDSELDDGAIVQSGVIAESGYRLSVMGVGSQQGAPIPRREGGFLKDNSGNIVVVKLKSAPLKELARIGDGVFTTVTNSDQDIKRMLDGDARVVDSDIEASDQKRQAEVWLERGPWIILLLVPLASLVFRRGWL